MKNILVLDDNRSILEVLTAGLGRYLPECTITSALDDEKGLEVLASVPIDLILTDLDIPMNKGFAFIEYALKNHPSVPLCVMTGNYSASILERLALLGVRQHIRKPFQLDILATLLRAELNLEHRRVPRAGTGHA